MLIAGIGVVLLFSRFGPLSTADAAVLALLAYLPLYLGITLWAFTSSTPEEIETWARREERGTFMQRYVLGTAPGPGVSLFVCLLALAVSVFWMPGLGGASLTTQARIGISVALVVLSWMVVLVSFTVTYVADNLLEEGHGLEFPGPERAGWSDHLYFACSVMTTFGTTDVTVTSREMRRTVVVNALIAFVFNTVILATIVSVLAT